MDFLTLAAGDATVVLAPDLGGAVVSWTRGENHIFRPPLDGAIQDRFVRGLASFALVPYSNRIARGKFRFSGIDYQLPATFSGNAIHGVGWQGSWAPDQPEPTRADLTFDHAPDPTWPFAFRARQSFSLSPEALECHLLVQNLHDGPAPVGLGHHPYFPRAPGATLQFTADAVWHNGPDMIPDRRTPVPPEWDHRTPRPLGSATLDNCFVGWRGGARITYPDRGYGITISADPVFDKLVVFVPPGKDFFAVEPVTNINDGINRMDAPDNGIRILQPGEIFAGKMNFAVEASRP
jgi:aldose 1-epimerase